MARTALNTRNCGDSSLRPSRCARRCRCDVYSDWARAYAAVTSVRCGPHLRFRLRPQRSTPRNPASPNASHSATAEHVVRAADPTPQATPAPPTRTARRQDNPRAPLRQRCTHSLRYAAASPPTRNLTPRDSPECRRHAPWLEARGPTRGGTAADPPPRSGRCVCGAAAQGIDVCVCLRWTSDPDGQAEALDSTPVLSGQGRPQGRERAGLVAAWTRSGNDGKARSATSDE